MKFLFIINSVAAGGAENHLLGLAKYLNKTSNTEIEILVLRREADVRGGASGLQREFEQVGISVTRLRDFCLSDLGRLLSLGFFLIKKKPDILHSHLPRADLLCSVIKLLFPSTNWISTVHDAYNRDKYRGFAFLFIFSFLLRRANQFIAVSDHVAHWIRDRYGKSAFSRTQIIYHGIGIKNSPTKMLFPDPKRPVIGCLARYEPRKGHDVLIKAMKRVTERVPDAQLWLAGSDPMGYAKRLSELVDSLGLKKNVTIDRYQDSGEFYRSIDIFALASRSEGFGIVLIEAMANKIPLVGSNIAPINHIVLDGETGFLAESNDFEDFADKILELIENPQRARGMSEAGFQRCASDFSLTAQLEATISLYHRLINETQSS